MHNEVNNTSNMSNNEMNYKQCDNVSNNIDNIVVEENNIATVFLFVETILLRLTNNIVCRF